MTAVKMLPPAQTAGGWHVLVMGREQASVQHTANYCTSAYPNTDANTDTV